MGQDSGEAGRRLIESERFPIAAISAIARAESWRKEVYRPIYHTHKWWAQRLGSVFRAILLGASLPPEGDLLGAFYDAPVLDGTVFDPFSGSGTTVGEARKLGLRAIGRDINPVAFGASRAALCDYDPAQVRAEFARLEARVGAQIREMHRTRLPDGTEADILYHFWVQTLACPGCGASVDLFSSRVFAGHATPRTHPRVHALCPACGGVAAALRGDTAAACPDCGDSFSLGAGSVSGALATCPGCLTPFAIAPAARAAGGPSFRQYAKLVLGPDGRKAYLRADEADEAAYAAASAALARRSVPDLGSIEPGRNTRQILAHGITRWRQLYNDRQALAMLMVADAIRAMPDEAMRGLFSVLLSGTAEFNNLLATYKGEGTGAVRHAFWHHVLRPERTPIEGNLWGTPASSGSFSTLFARRLMPAVEYARAPFEVRPVAWGNPGRAPSEKVPSGSHPFGAPAASDYAGFAAGNPLYLSCGDSSRTDLPDGSVDLVVTDPPYFDNLHYSELADFFLGWLRYLWDGRPPFAAATTRSSSEVQHEEGAVFADRLGGVFAEGARVLRPDGLLAFTFHHARPEAWLALFAALRSAGLAASAVQPVFSELPGSVPLWRNSEPISIDIILVARHGTGSGEAADDEEYLRRASEGALAQARALSGFESLGRGDLKTLLWGHLLLALSRAGDEGAAARLLSSPIPEAVVAGLADSLPPGS